MRREKGKYTSEYIDKFTQMIILMCGGFFCVQQNTVRKQRKEGNTMKNMKFWRTALVATLVLTVMLSVTGGTIAWFTDSVTSDNNIIKSGTLDVTMEWKDAISTGTQQAYKDASQGAIFNYDLWEPGYVEAKYVKISNVGTLALKYELNIVATGDVSKLADVIDVYFAEGELDLTGREMTGMTKVGTLSDVLAGMPTNAKGDLLVDQVDTVTIALKMQESAGNEYQNLSIGSNFAVKLEATQLTHESDSFDDQYDKDAGYNYGKRNVGPYKLNVLSDGVAFYEDATKTYTIDVATVAQGGYNANQGERFFAGYTVNVAGYGENATVKFTKDDGTQVTWKFVDEERDGFIVDGVYQNWTSVGTKRAYHYDIDGDGETDFTVINDVSKAKVAVSDVEHLNYAVKNGNDVILTADIVMPANELVIDAEATVTIDLNGKTLSAKSDVAEGSRAIENKGTLTLTNGTVTYEGIGDPNHGYRTNTINNSGKLVIDGATIINTTNSGSSNAIDNAPGATLIVNNGTIKSEKVTIRLRDGSKATINDGDISGARAVQVHLIHNNKQATELTITGGTFTSINPDDPLALYSYAYGNCTHENTTINISGGTFNGYVAFHGGNKTAYETLNITGGTFNGDLGLWEPDGDDEDTETDWVDIPKP